MPDLGREDNSSDANAIVADSAVLPAETLTEQGTTRTHTKGPWAWMGNQHGIYLATTHSGRRYVLGFRRMGTQAAQPVFQVNERLVPAADLVEFEVGDGTARGFAQGKADESVYRYDITGIDAPDARLIAAAPELLAFALAHEAWEADMIRHGDWSDECVKLTPALHESGLLLAQQRNAAVAKALAAIAKAEVGGDANAKAIDTGMTRRGAIGQRREPS